MGERFAEWAQGAVALPLVPLRGCARVVVYRHLSSIVACDKRQVWIFYSISYRETTPERDRRKDSIIYSERLQFAGNSFGSPHVQLSSGRDTAGGGDEEEVSAS